MKKSFLKYMLGGLVFLCTAGSVADPSPKKLRVGFFKFDGYHMCQDLPGNEIHRSGYGYDVLQMLLPYTNWDYEYIGYERGWSMMLPMLEHGEIDLVTSAVKIPEKEKKFDFSKRPIGYSATILTVKAGSRHYLPHDYEHWNGMKVGVIRGNSKNDVFADFAKKKGFTYQEVVFTEVDEMTAALQKSQIDAIVTGSLRRLHNEWLYEQLDVRPFYIIVKKGNQHLLDEINEAMDKMELDFPGFASTLHKKYYDYAAGAHGEVPLSLDERVYINNSKEAGTKFRVLFNPDRVPFSSIDDGDFQGVLRLLMDTVASRSGLIFEPVLCKTRKEYYRKLRNHECELVLDFRADPSNAEQYGYILTPSYFSAAVARVSRKHFDGKVTSCAVVAESETSGIIRHDLHEGVRIVNCPTQDDVMAAVRAGQADVGYVFTRTAENAILSDPFGALVMNNSGLTFPMSIAVRRDTDRRLINILSKTVRSISDSEIRRALLADSLRMQRKVTIREILVSNPLAVLFSLVGLIAVLGSALAVVIIYQRRAGKAAALLVKNSRMWRLLIDTLPIHIFAKDANNDFKFVFNNKARENFYGISSEKFSTINDTAILPPDVVAEHLADDTRLCKAGTGMNKTFTCIKNKEGVLRRLYTMTVPFSAPDGTNLVLACSLDQTELDEARRKAEESAEWFQKTLISIGDAVLTTDIKGHITLLNPAAEKLLGTTLSECKGKAHTDYFKIVSYLDGSDVPSPIERCLNAGEIVTLANHTDLISRTGTRYHIADSAAPIRDKEGCVIGAVLVFRDVTREYDLRDQLQASTEHLREALDQAQHASSAKGVFLSQMSHEIRTPLNAVIGYLNIAQESGGDQEKIKECLEKGLDASSHLLSIINDILDISSIESGKLKIAREDFDFKHLLTGIVSMFYNQAQRKNVKFDLQLREFTEEWLVGDALRVNQVLLNLLSNALKFTPEGGSVTLLVKQLAIVHNHVQLMLQVSDTGCGMSDEYKSRLFKPFEQQDASTARKFGGTGLGLSITKNLVTMMGGTISVESTEGVGTAFTVHLPFERSTKVPMMAEADFSKLRALVVDDQEEDRTYIQMVLSKCGVKSDAVGTGADAIRQLKRRLYGRHPYDLCLVDLRLTDMDGIEVSRKIRELPSGKNEVPIILVTAYDVTSVIADAHVAGVNKVIQKPLFQSTFFDFLMSGYYHLGEKEDTKEVQSGLVGLSVLLVEDNRMNMDISTQYLERAGMKITPAWNGKEAVDVFTQSAPGTYQAILMDIQMPIMDGYQATKTIRASAHPEAKTIPIIAMTANAFNEDVVAALQAGMNDHISKPIVYNHLFSSLSKLTRHEAGEQKDEKNLTKPA